MTVQPSAMAAASRTGGVLSSRPMKKYSFKDSTSALKQVVNKATHSTGLLDQSVQAMKKQLNHPKCSVWIKENYLPT